MSQSPGDRKTGISLPLDLIATILGRMDLLPAVGRRLAERVTGIPGFGPFRDFDERERLLAANANVSQEFLSWDAWVDAPLAWEAMEHAGRLTVHLSYGDMPEEDSWEYGAVGTGTVLIARFQAKDGDEVVARTDFLYCTPAYMFGPNDPSELPDLPRCFYGSHAEADPFYAVYARGWNQMLRSARLSLPGTEEPVRELQRWAWARASGAEEEGSLGFEAAVADGAVFGALYRTDEDTFGDGPGGPPLEGTETTLTWSYIARTPMGIENSFSECYVACGRHGFDEFDLGLMWTPDGVEGVDVARDSRRLSLRYASPREMGIEAPGMDPDTRRLWPMQSPWLEALSEQARFVGLDLRDLLLYFRIILARIRERPEYPRLDEVTQGFRDLAAALREAAYGRDTAVAVAGGAYALPVVDG